MTVDLYVLGALMEDLVICNLDGSLIVTVEKGWLQVLNA